MRKVMDEVDIKKQPYHSIFLDLINHPYYATHQEQTSFTADFLHQKGYRSEATLSPDREAVIDAIQEAWNTPVGHGDNFGTFLERAADSILKLIKPPEGDVNFVNKLGYSAFEDKAGNMVEPPVLRDEYKCPNCGREGVVFLTETVGGKPICSSRMSYAIGDEVETIEVRYLGRWIRLLEKGIIENRHVSPAGQEVYDVRLEDDRIYTFAPREIALIE